MNEKTYAFNQRTPENVCKQLVSKVSFFYSADLRTRSARAANFPSRKKSITLLTCYINNYIYMVKVKLIHCPGIMSRCA
jgi:hypothetical protein